MQHKFIDLLEQSRWDSTELTQALHDFSTPKDRTMQNFKEGVKRFIQIANMMPDERPDFFGSIYGGLYDNNQLARLWNVDCEEDEIISPHALDSIVSSDWEVIDDNGAFSFKYIGSTPTEALNNLFRHTTVIDCGIFCQLGIWFGLRYILGDTVFNAEFGQAPFLITRSNFEPPLEDHNGSGNPLYAFFTDNMEDTVSIEHIFNDRDYNLKHFGGNEQGHIGLVIDQKYYLFSPFNPHNGISRNEVVQDLLTAFNNDRDENDAKTLELFRRYPDFFESIYGSIYAFDFSSIHWFRMLLCNVFILQKFANELDSVPECRLKMQELFNDQTDSGKDVFISSFSDEYPEKYQDQYETLFAMPQTKLVFQTLLVANPAWFAIYYHAILNDFIAYTNHFEESVLTLEQYYERQNERLLLVPSLIHFNLSQFLIALDIGRELSPILSECSDFSDTPKHKRIKLTDINPFVLSPYQDLNLFTNSQNLNSAEDNSPRQASIPVLGWSETEN